MTPKVKLIITTFPDGSQKVEVKKRFERYFQCDNFLKKNGFTRDITQGNVWRFLSQLATAYIFMGEQTHPYSAPNKHLYSITIYPKTK